MTFTADGQDFKNKVLKDRIEVSVVLDLDLDVGWVDMLEADGEPAPDLIGRAR